jgi:hypothetical protein
MGGTEASNTDRVRNIPAPGGEMYGFGSDPKSETTVPTYWRKMKGTGWVPAALPVKDWYVPPQIKGPQFDPKDVPIIESPEYPNLHYDPNYSGQDAMLISALSRLFRGGLT